jgi:hypothetical protein
MKYPGHTYGGFISAISERGMTGPKLQLMWQRVDARPAPCLDLELVCGVPIEALEPTSGEAVNPQVGPILWRPVQLS